MGSCDMELDLGLALPISSHFPTKLSDVHRDHHHFDCVENASLGTLEFKNLMVKDPNKKKKKRRSFDNAIEDREEEDQQQVENKTLSLLVWSGRHPSKDGDEEEDRESRSDMIEGDEEEEEEGIVGWPPIGTYRKRLLDGDGCRRQRFGVGGGSGSGDKNSIFVKVRMEGVMIGRKINIMLFDSYQSLTNSLLNMFAKHYKKGENDDGDQEPYILSYLDKEGDWLLAGDVPWETFIESVQRMEILKRRA